MFKEKEIWLEAEEIRLSENLTKILGSITEFMEKKMLHGESVMISMEKKMLLKVPRIHYMEEAMLVLARKIMDMESIIFLLDMAIKLREETIN